MSVQELKGEQSGMLSVSCPGGMARQYRVQIADAATASQWRLVGSFREVSLARDCAQQYTRAGRMTRVVACRSLPTAA